jgi:exodeoxyribonuclease V alpha subunit
MSSVIAPGLMTTTSARATAVAGRLTATPERVEHAGSMDGNIYEQWAAGIDIDTGRTKGRLRKDANGLRFVEVTVNGPRTWSLAAALHPEISAALDAAQDKAAAEIVGCRSKWRV